MIFVQWSLKASLGFPRPDRRQVPTQGWVAQVIFVNLYLCISIGFFVLTFLFHKFTLLISSPRPDQDIEEPPSKRLTEPADVLRMPVSDLLIFHLLFTFSLSRFSHTWGLQALEGLFYPRLAPKPEPDVDSSFLRRRDSPGPTQPPRLSLASSPFPHFTGSTVWCIL